MISDVIVDEIGAAIGELTIGSNLFGETAKSETYVCVKTTSTVEPAKPIGNLLRSRFQVFVRGWSVDKCMTLAEQIKAVVLNISGPKTVNNSSGGVESYLIKAVDHLNGPIPVSHDGNNGSSMNFNIFYALTIS